MGYAINCDTGDETNAATVSFAKALAPEGIKVNAIEPGTVATDLNGHRGALPGFFGHEGIQPW